MTGGRIIGLFLLFCLTPLLKGQTWELYDSLNSDLPGNRVNTLFIDAYGGKWFGTMEGLAHFADGSWRIYTEEHGLAARQIRHLTGSMENGKARLFVSTPGGVSELSYDAPGLLELNSYSSVNSGLTSDSVSSIIPDAGVAYYGSPVGLDIRSGESWIFVDQITTSEEVISLQQLTCMAMTPHGWNYMGTREQGVVRLRYDVDGVTGASSYSTDWSGLLTDRINDIHITGEGNQWYATDKGLAYHMGYETKKNWATYTEYSSGLISNMVHAVASDEKDITWAGTDKGIARFDGFSWSSLSPLEEAYSYSVFDIAFDLDESIWFASDMGVFHLDESVSDAGDGPEASLVDLKLGIFPGLSGEKLIIQIDVPSPRWVSIYLIDLKGQVLQQLCDRRTVFGKQNFDLNIQEGQGSMPEGIYIILVKTEKECLSRKILIRPPRGS